MESDRPLTAATIATPDRLKVQDTAHRRSYRAQGMLDAAHYLQAQTWVTGAMPKSVVSSKASCHCKDKLSNSFGIS